MRWPAPLLYVSLAQREWPWRSPLARPPFGDVRRLWSCRNPVVLNKLGVSGMFPLNCDLGHNWMRLKRGAVEGGCGDTILARQRPYAAKSLFRIGLRCAKGIPFRPADLARGHS